MSIVDKIKEKWKDLTDRFKTSDRNTGDLYEKVMTEGCLPPKEDEEAVALAVLAIYVKAVEAFKPWHEKSDLYRRYYRGEERTKRPKSATSTGFNPNHNIIFSDIEAVKPIIKDSLVKPGLYATESQYAEAGRQLDLRVGSLWRSTNFQSERAPKIIHDMLIDGVFHSKLIIDDNNEPTVISVSNRRIFFDWEAGSFDEAKWVGDAIMESVGDTKRKYKGKADAVAAQKADEYKPEKDMPEGPPGRGTSVRTTVMETAPGDIGGTAAVANSSSDGSEKLKKSERIIQFELWFKDGAQKDDGTPLYPNGRLVVVGIGANKQEVALTGNQAEAVTLEDREPPKCYRKLFEKKGIFPFFQAQCHDDGDLWGLSEVAFKMDIQDLINDALYAIHQNWKSINSAIWFVLKKAGLSKSSFINRPGHVVEFDSSVTDDVRKAAVRFAPSSIGPDAIPLLGTYMGMSDKSGGQSDLLRGQAPANMSGYAIDKLQSYGSGRFVFVGQALNNCYIQIYYGLACMVQDLAEIGAEQPGELINHEADANAQERYVRYDPSQVAQVTFKVEACRQLTQSEVIQLLSAAADMDAKSGIPGIGALALQYSDDKGLMNGYKDLIAQKQQMEQSAAEAQQKNAIELKNAEVRAEIMKQGLANNAIQNRNQDANQTKNNSSGDVNQRQQPGSSAGGNAGRPDSGQSGGAQRRRAA